MYLVWNKGRITIGSTVSLLVLQIACLAGGKLVMSVHSTT